VLIAGLVSWCNVSFAELLERCKNLAPSTLALAFAVHVAIHAMRAQRFRTLIPSAERPPYLSTFAAASAHNLAAYVLPAKTGEVALVVYLKAHGGVSNKAGLAALLVSRVLDLSTLALALALASIYLALARPDVAPKGAFAFAVACIAAAGVLSLLASRGDWIVAIGARLARWAQLHRMKLGEKLLARSTELGSALREAAGGVLVIATLQSLAMWAGIFAFYEILGRGFGLGSSIGFFETAFGSGFAVLSNLLPINSFAGAGTQEVGWVFGFGLLGLPRELALSSGLAVHAVQLANTIALGLLGHLGMGVLPRRVAAKSPQSAREA
jgi:uncharacterized protein (TIRG00374 family)